MAWAIFLLLPVAPAFLARAKGRRGLLCWLATVALQVPVWWMLYLNWPPRGSGTAALAATGAWSAVIVDAFVAAVLAFCLDGSGRQATRAPEMPIDLPGAAE